MRFCRKAYRRGNLTAKSFTLPSVREQKVWRTNMKQRFKDMPTVRLTHPVKLADRLQVQNSRQSRGSGHRQPGRDKALRNKYLHYTLINSRIHHTHAHSEVPMYTAAWNSVSSTSYMGGRELWNKKSSTADWGQRLHMPITVCVRMFCG